MGLVKRAPFIVILMFFLFSNITGAIVISQFPQNIIISKNYNGLVKVVDNYSTEKTLTHVATGDLNGDGFDDVIIGSMYSDDNGLVNSGTIYIIFGNTEIFLNCTFDLSTAQNILKIAGNELYDFLGRSIETGDVNGDGYDDLLFSSHSIDILSSRQSKGNTYLLIGNPDLSSRELIDLRNPPTDIIEISGNDEMGSASGFGDFNGDGFDDLIIGAASDYNLGKSYIIKGANDFATHDIIDLASNYPSVIRISGVSEGDMFGYSANSGDFNNDGFDDAVIGARGADSNLKENCGKSYIFWGSENFFSQESIDIVDSSENITMINGAESYTYSGSFIEIGNIDNDNFNDLILESGRYSIEDRTYNGAIYIIKGYSSFSEIREIDLSESFDNVIKIHGKLSNDMLAKCVITDINSDGNNDIIVRAEGATGYGEIYFLTDEALRNQSIIDLKYYSEKVNTLYGDEISGQIGFDFSSGDYNGDGKDDLLIGNRDNPNGSFFSDGVVYIVSGAGISSTENYSFEVTSTNTGNSSTITILNENSPSIFGELISGGSKIGVFTKTGICAGVGEWYGTQIDITVWGDNTDTPEIEGFVDGDQYYYRILDATDETVYEAHANYDSGNSVFLNDDHVVISKLWAGIFTCIEKNVLHPFSLDQNYPNPFNPVTSIPFTILSGGHVKLNLFDVRGIKVDTLVDSEFPEGIHLIQWNAGNNPAGIYFYQLETESFIQTKKMLLLK